MKLTVRAPAIAAMICLHATSYAAGRVEPDPATPQDLVVFTDVPGASCPYGAADVTVVRTGTRIDVSYDIAPIVPPPICFTGPPLSVVVPLGRFAPGDYVVESRATLDGKPLAPTLVPFSVRGDGGPVTELPALGASFGALMVAALVLLARRRLAIGSVRCRDGESP
jgi:hypothetical protein